MSASPSSTTMTANTSSLCDFAGTHRNMLARITHHIGFRTRRVRDIGPREVLYVHMEVPDWWLQNVFRVFYKTHKHLYESRVDYVRRDESGRVLFVCVGFVEAGTTPKTPVGLEVGVNLVVGSTQVSRCLPADIEEGFKAFPQKNELSAVQRTILCSVERHAGFRSQKDAEHRLRDVLRLSVSGQEDWPVRWFDGVCVYFKTKSHLCMSLIRSFEREGNRVDLLCEGFHWVIPNESTPPNLELGVNLVIESLHDVKPLIARVELGRSELPTLPS